MQKRNFNRKGEVEGKWMKEVGMEEKNGNEKRQKGGKE